MINIKLDLSREDWMIDTIDAYSRPDIQKALLEYDINLSPDLTKYDYLMCMTTSAFLNSEIKDKVFLIHQDDAVVPDHMDPLLNPLVLGWFKFSAPRNKELALGPYFMQYHHQFLSYYNDNPDAKKERPVIQKQEFFNNKHVLNKIVEGLSWMHFRRFDNTFKHYSDQDLQNRNRDMDACFCGWMDYCLPAISHHRELCVKTLEGIKNRNIFAKRGRVLNLQGPYEQMMLNSKSCISPWGYGETCHRDFEAMVHGAIIIKPDLDYCITYPDIFRSDLSYVKCDRNFSDLTDRIDYVRGNPIKMKQMRQDCNWLITEARKPKNIAKHLSDKFRYLIQEFDR
jgi:hypothetical protein